MNYKLILIFLNTLFFTFQGTTQTVGTLQNDESSLRVIPFFHPFQVLNPGW